ncbi:SDR family oxidoreductase [Sphingobacterium oryzagri]|uniref:dTDP-4-dehydrorhamnose reductase n=1 Tax=Sphingobacterium oryzagri TaxID=3025669 RepID=A0ABY7WEK6_9SPHI|nr:SDR family oxidoreductase [Sphingobacterium sp. KACC 22765]WDF68076.1 SDR family oxidoreductase [Sphingobacterium sp. KACC 22765]
MRIILTGSNGFLGQKLTDKLVTSANLEMLLALSKSENRNPNKTGYQFATCDFSSDFSTFEKQASTFAPTHIIHTAALTSVEVCEKDPAACQQINVETVGKLAAYCKQHNIHLTFLSTDFVFDGADGPYDEQAKPNPCNAYGLSKWQAEQLIQQSGCQAAILRTILVYGCIADPNRSNFVLWVKNKLTANEPINVVKDQWRTPTWVDDLADACIIASKKNANGIFHISGETLHSIYEIAVKVAEHWQLDKQLIRPITAEEIGQAENRPRKTGFIIDKAKQQLGWTATQLRDSFTEIEKQLAKINTHD